MQPSIKDVARHSGVSYKTVSRVINGERHVSAATRERVHEAVTALGYRPDHGARSLRQGRTHALRLLLVRRHDRLLTEPFLEEVLAGIVDRAARQGYALLLEVATPEDTALAAPGAAERRVDGTILLDAREASPLVPTLTQGGAPCVTLPTRATIPGLGWVYADFRGGAARAVDHLVGLGHRRIAHLAGEASLTERDRHAGYLDGLAKAGIPRDPTLVFQAGNQRHQGEAALGELLDSRVDFTAVFAVNDAAALGALDCLQRRGLRTPEDVSVVGFDDTYFAPYASPPLTTIRLPAYQMGLTAAALAIDAVEDAQPFPSGRELPVELVIRASTGPPPEQG